MLDLNRLLWIIKTAKDGEKIYIPSIEGPDRIITVNIINTAKDRA